MNKFLYWDVHHYGNLYSVFRIIIVQGSESKQISSCQIESDTLNAQLGQNSLCLKVYPISKFFRRK